MIRETVWYKRNIDCLPTVTNFLTGLTLKVILFETFDYSVLMRNQTLWVWVYSSRCADWNLISFLDWWLIIFYYFLVNRLALWDEPNIDLKCHGVRSDYCFWPLRACITSVVNVSRMSPKLVRTSPHILENRGITMAPLFLILIS